MVKRYLLVCIGVFFFGTSSVLFGADAEITLEDSTSASGFSVNDSSGNTIMRVRGDGRVGIGTTEPDVKLHVIGQTRSSSFRAADGTKNLPSYRFESDADVGVFRPETDTLAFTTAGTERMRIDISGNVGIGTTAPSHPLHMGSGAHVTSGGVWTDASSRDYKENIEMLTLDEAVETFNSLNPVKFNYKKDKSENYVGFIAEDVPDLVATQDRKGLAPMDITAVLTKVVQEQQEILREQQEEMVLMSKKIEKLESAINFGVK